LRGSSLEGSSLQPLEEFPADSLQIQRFELMRSKMCLPIVIAPSHIEARSIMES